MTKTNEIPKSLAHLIRPHEEELSTAKFAMLSGHSQRHIEYLCDAGKLRYRRKSPLPLSHKLIPASELTKMGNPEMPQEEELTTEQFAMQSGLSARYVAKLCERGEIRHRRRTALQFSDIVIPTSELSKMKNLGENQ